MPGRLSLRRHKWRQAFYSPADCIHIDTEHDASIRQRLPDILISWQLPPHIRIITDRCYHFIMTDVDDDSRGLLLLFHWIFLLRLRLLIFLFSNLFRQSI